MNTETLRNQINKAHYTVKRVGRIAEQVLIPGNRARPDRDFVFIHVPKCGGTSIRHFFRMIFRESSIAPETLLSGFPQRSEFLSARPQVFLGHLGYQFAAERPSEKCVILRHPADRILSIFSYVTSPSIRQPLIGGIEKGISLEEFLSSSQPGIVMNIQNAMAWQLYGCYSEKFRMKHEHVDNNQLLRGAIKNLDRVGWVGLTEELDLFCKNFSLQKTGREIHPEHRNKSSKSLTYQDLSNTERELLDSLIVVDLLVYERARERYAISTD